MAWDEAKRQAARERMAKATAVRMAKIAERKNASIVATSSSERATAVAEPFNAVIPSDKVVVSKPDLVLAVRRIHVGSFTGLWELSRILPDGTTEIITDANTKSIVINLARNEIMKCGQ